MGYIDVEKLIAEIKRYKNKADERLKIKGRTFSEEQKDLALQNLCGNLLHFINSHQQEQTEKIVQPTVTTKGWVAKDCDGTVRLFFLCKPQRIDNKRYRYWYGGSNASKQLSNDSFPDLKWEDEPIEVALLINK